MNNRCFVKSAALVSCQEPLSDEWFENPQIFEESYVRSREPDSREFIVPSEARRMSRLLKRAVCTSITALNKAGIHNPDAIITGTGMGCMENSEKILIDLSRFGEKCLKPTLFMQSTHNTIGSLIAIVLKCHGYNSTYSHKGVSFESALLDAWIQIKMGVIRNALVGSHDEVTPFTSLVLERTHPEFRMISEASMSTVLSALESGYSICEVSDVRILHNRDCNEIANLVDSPIDSLLLLGQNSNPINDEQYDNLINRLKYTPTVLKYRHIFGDSFSSSAAGFYSAVRILERQTAPGHMVVQGVLDTASGIRTITMINCVDNTTWSIIRLKRI